jgi:ABC-type transport system substrate-binding protein/class 3 adenylate cyclase
MKCGASLDTASDFVRETRLESLHKATPPRLQERMREVGAELEGERKLVTILFADIVGSTSIAEKLDPEVWKEIVAGAHLRVGEAIYRYEGTIAQLLGDGVLAFFGAPLTHEDDPFRAVLAALDIQDIIREYEHELKDLVEEFQMRVGINTGEVVIGNIGTDLHMEYLALGDAVNIAARLQATADPEKVLLSDSTARLLGDSFELKSLGEVPIKGKQDTVEIYEVVEVKTLPRRRLGLQELRTPFVDREKELDTLRSSLLKLCEGQGQIVSLEGEPGIGKTRLLEEVRAFLCEMEEDVNFEGAQPSSLRWLEGRALSYGGSLSYWIITQLLLADLGLSDGASQVEIKVALRQRMKERFSEDQSNEVMPYIAKLLGIPLDGEAKDHIEALEGESLKSESHRALGEYFTAVAKKAPTVLIFEDMHWTDPSSMEVLENLLPLTDHVPLMILMLMRNERDRGSWKLRIKAEMDFHHRFMDIHLQRLSEADSITLVKHLLGSEALPDEILKPILTRSEGNPFYLEEVVRHMIEEGMIVQDDEGWHVTEAMSEIGIPDTLQGVLLARIDRLEDDVRHTLQMASVIGKSFLYRILEAISEVESELDAHLSQLQRLDLVREKARIPELEYIFKQTLTQEVAYNSLLHKRRKEFHLKVGDALENLFPQRVDDFLGLLAYHFEAAEEHDKAVDYLIRAGDRARLTFSYYEAIDFYNRAISLLEEENNFDLAARTSSKIGLVYNTLFDFDNSRKAFQAGFELWQQATAIQSPKRYSVAPHGLRINWVLPKSLDPGILIDTYSQDIAQQIFSGLVEFGSNKEIVPNVAKNWSIEDGGRKYRFALRTDVFWSDGTQVTSSDFEYAWKRIILSEIISRRLEEFYPIAGVRDFQMGHLDDPNCLGIKTPDDFEIVVELENPTSVFLPSLATAAFFPVPRHIIERKGSNWSSSDEITTNGPFMLEIWEPGKFISLSRNHKFHGNFKGNLEQIQFLHVEDPKEVITKYELDELDIGYLPYGDMNLARMSFAGENFSAPSIETTIAWFDVMHPQFSRRTVRQAFALAVNQENLANEKLHGFPQPGTGGFIPPGMPGHSGGIGLSYDIGLARKLLADVGFPNGSGFPTIGCLTYLKSGYDEFLKEQWKENLGVELVLERTSSPGEFIEKQSNPTYSVYIGSLTNPFPDPDGFLGNVMKWGIINWSNEEYSQLIKHAREISSYENRIELYRKADKILIDEVGVLPLVYQNIYALVKPWVKNFPLGIIINMSDVILEPH